MSDARLKVFPGTYDNETAYEHVINYVTQKALWGGYGFFPYNPEQIIQAFEQSYLHSIQSAERRIWHFTITFATIHDIHFLYELGNRIAREFSNHYQTVFSVDTYKRPHLHFAVNAFSYYPDHPILSAEMMKKQAQYILSDINHSYTNLKDTTLSFPEVIQ